MSTSLDTIIHSRHFCGQCNRWTVLCGHCGNNSCNGGYGMDGECPHCPEAYEVQDDDSKLMALPIGAPDPPSEQERVLIEAIFNPPKGKEDPQRNV
jgi:hypothetical protein